MIIDSVLVEELVEGLDKYERDRAKQLNNSKDARGMKDSNKTDDAEGSAESLDQLSYV